MTLPVPRRLLPIHQQTRRREGARLMLAILSCVLFILAAFDVTIGSLSPLDVACLAGAALALHFAVPLLVSGRRTG